MPSGQRMLRPPGGSTKSLRDDDFHAVRIDVDRSARLDHVGHALEPDPAARIAAHREAVQAVVEVLLHVGRIQHRDQAGLEDVLALVRKRRGLGRVVVAREDEDAAMLRAAGGVAVLEHVAAAIHARALAVPHREHAVVFRALEQIDLLRAPDRRGGEVFVDAGLELDVMLLEEFLRAVARTGPGRRAASRGIRRRSRRCSAPPQRRARAASWAGARAPGCRSGKRGPSRACTCRREKPWRDRRVRPVRSSIRLHKNRVFEGALPHEGCAGRSPSTHRNRVPPHAALRLAQSVCRLNAADRSCGRRAAGVNSTYFAASGLSQYGSGPKDSTRKSMNARVFAGRCRRCG